MPDITMCVNSKCLIRETCYRYRAISSQVQSMAMFKPEANGLCKYHWVITNEAVVSLDEADNPVIKENDNG